MAAPLVAGRSEADPAEAARPARILGIGKNDCPVGQLICVRVPAQQRQRGALRAVPTALLPDACGMAVAPGVTCYWTWGPRPREEEVDR